MLKLIISLLILLTTTTLFCQTVKGEISKIKIDPALYDYAEISPYKTLKKSIRPKRLSKNMGLEFVKNWNSSNVKAKCAEKYQYKISIYFVDYTRRTFNISNSTVNEEGNMCIAISDAGLANKLWKSK